MISQTHVHPPTAGLGQHKIHNLVFKGGGVKGLAFAGAVQVLESHGILGNIKRLAGSSAGAISAALLAVGYTPDELLFILSKKDFEEFKDDDLGVVRDASRFITKFGLYKGKAFEDWLKDMIQKKTGNGDITFKGLLTRYGRELVITGTSLNRRETHYFNPHTTGDMKIYEAVRISMSIPLFFQAVERDDNLYVDGGVLDNFPIYVFDLDPFDPKEALRAPPSEQTLGLKLESDNEKLIESEEAPPTIKNMKEYVQGLLDCVLGHIEQLKMKPNDEKRTIKINTRYISAVDFGISDNEKSLLIHEGRKAAESFFSIKCPKDYVGYLIVNLIEVKGVVWRGSPITNNLPVDPYCMLRTENPLGVAVETQKSSTKHLTTNPCWNKRFVFKIKSIEEFFVLSIKDSTLLGKDRVFGTVTVPLREVLEFTDTDHIAWYPVATKNASVHLSFCFSPVY